MDISSLCAQNVYASLVFLFPLQGNHTNISFLHAQIVNVFFCVLLKLQGSRMHHMEISFIRAEFVYVSLGCLLQLQGSHMNHIYI